jgi:hypothetical protein
VTIAWETENGTWATLDTIPPFKGEGFITVSYPHNLAAGSNALSLQSSPDLIDFKFEGSVTLKNSEIAEVRYRSYSPTRETRYFRLQAN